MIMCFIEDIDARDKYEKSDKQNELRQNLGQLHAKHGTCTDFSMCWKKNPKQINPRILE